MLRRSGCCAKLFACALGISLAVPGLPLMSAQALAADETGGSNDITENSAESSVILPFEDGDEADFAPQSEVTDFSSLTTVVSEADDSDSVVASGTCGTGVTWILLSSGLLKIDGTGAMSFTSSTNPPYKSYASQVKVVEIGEGVTSICGFAFSGCKNVQGVFFHCQRTSGYQAFFKQYYDSGLNSGARFYFTPGDSTWDGCSEHCATAWVEGMLDIDWSHSVDFGICGDSTFWTLDDSGCLSIRGTGDVSSSVASGSVASGYGDAVNTMIVEEGVESISTRCLGSSSTLSSVVINAALTTLPDRMFYGDTALSDIELPDTLAGIPTSAFEGCTSLEKVNIPDACASIGEDAFKNCTSLVSVDRGDALTSIGESAFEGCTSLASFDFNGVESIGEKAFYGCSSLDFSDLGDALTTLGANAFYGTAAVDVTFPETLNTIYMSAFSGCASLERIKFLGDMPTFKYSPYSGKSITAAHASGNATWESRDKYSLVSSSSEGDITWYSVDADGALVEDDYIPNGEITALTSGVSRYRYYDSNWETNSFTFELDKKSYLQIVVNPTFSKGCTHQHFIIKVIDRSGNNGTVLNTYYLSSDSGGKNNYANLSLPAGSYCVEATFWTSHDSEHTAILNLGYVLSSDTFYVAEDGAFSGSYLSSGSSSYWIFESDGEKPTTVSLSSKSDMVTLSVVDSSGSIAHYNGDSSEATLKTYRSVGGGKVNLQLSCGILPKGTYMVKLTPSPSSSGKGYSGTVEQTTFTDVLSTTAHSADIEWLASSGVSTGWTESDGTKTFRPFTGVVRADMAAFLYRMAGSPEYTAPTVSPFADVDSSTAHYKEICWLAESGISQGWTEADGTRTFRPYTTVVRADMAAFLYRLAGSPDYEVSGKPFTDCNSSTAHYKEVCWLASTGVSEGWTEPDGSKAFRPYTTVVRADMAAFLHRMRDKGLA